MVATRYLTASLRSHPRGALIAETLAAALAAVDPAAAVQAHLRREGKHIQVGERNYDLDEHGRVFLIGAGKAGTPMALAAAGLLGETLYKGLVIVKEGYLALGQKSLPSNLEILEAGHPVPDERGRAGTQRLLALLGETSPEDLVVALISGGGSALLTAPAAGLGLGELQTLTGLLLASGATIAEINTLRKHLDQVKGGGLARAAAPARLAALILSDVVANPTGWPNPAGWPSPLDVIASGPSVGDPSTFAQALEILARYQLVERTPAPILERLQAGRAGQIPETAKPSDPIFGAVQNILVGDNRRAALAGLEYAHRQGFHTQLLTTFLEGEARQAGGFLAGIGRELARGEHPLPRPACLVAGGETTVTLLGDGRGGRNQELALAAVAPLAGLADICLVALATDGGDGPTDAAGAVVTGESLGRAQALGLNPQEYLARNDAYHFFEPLGDLLKPGPTLTNVNDLVFLFAL